MKPPPVTKCRGCGATMPKRAGRTLCDRCVKDYSEGVKIEAMEKYKGK